MDVATSTIMNQRQKQNRSMVMCSRQYFYICSLPCFYVFIVGSQPS